MRRQWQHSRMNVRELQGLPTYLLGLYILALLAK
jgi:hypothetical protein